MRQRLGIAAALLHAPDILILDEPTTGLDPQQIVSLRTMLRRIGDKRTVVLSTHVLGEVRATCDRVLILHRGSLVADGPTEAALAARGAHIVTVGIARATVAIDDTHATAALSTLNGVRHTRALAPGDLAVRVELVADEDPRESIWRWAVDHGHVIVELHERATDLEEVFLQLTAGEGA
jgi:ABC-2 type transport system ATP-binding protein